MADFLRTAEKITREAGVILREGYGRVETVEYKGEINLLTEFDLRSEKFILEALRQAFPEHAIHAEESGKQSVPGDYEWLIDPLDGTTNFAHGFPAFAVSLALTRRGQLLVGAVYDPLRDEMFLAEAGQGATLNGHRLRVTAQADLGRALLATGFPYDVRTNSRNNFAEFRQFHLRAQAVRRAGCASLDCAYVAAGRFDGFWEFWLNPWDVGAGALLAREAGGRVTTGAGNPNFLGAESIVVSNGLLHDQMLCILREGDAAPLPKG